MHASMQMTYMFNKFIARANANDVLDKKKLKSAYIGKYFEIVVILVLILKNIIILKKSRLTT